MEYIFSERSKNLKPSVIRQIFKYASDPSYISLSAGNPSPQAFPAEEIRDISNAILTEKPVDALQYSITEGYAPLIKQLKEYMQTKHQISLDRDSLIITAGAQQVMDLTAKSLLNEGDIVVCEAPSFIGSLNTFRSYNAKLIGVDVLEDGIDIDQLSLVLRENERVKLIYTIPNFQNPSGITMSGEKRRQLYDLAKKYNVLILEDDPYGELYYVEEPPRSIKSLDKDGLVIYAGSFSKTISPGLRVGWCVAPAEIIQKLVVCKQGSDVHTNIWAQQVCSRFLDRYDYDLHLSRLRSLYSEKARFGTSLLETFAPDISYNKVTGGLFIWCKVPENIQMLDFVQQAIEQKVCVVPGNAFLTDEQQKSQAFRINFTTPTDAQLEKGIKILGEIIIWKN